MERPIARAEKLTTHHDSRGNLTELIHCYDLPRDEVLVDPEDPREYIVIEEGKRKVPKFFPRFGQTYVVRNEQAGVIRAFHKHEKQWDYFTVVNGKAKVWVVNPEKKEVKCFILSGANMTRLIIPPGWWHGWESLMLNTILISTVTEVYDRENPDEERVSYECFDHLGVIWGVIPK